MRSVRSELQKGNRVIIPPIVYYEVKRGLMANNAPKKLEAFEGICNMLGVEDMGKGSMDAAAKIYDTQRQRGRPVEDTDILIAAFCINRDYTLVTDNVKHFEVIDDLRFINWAR